MKGFISNLIESSPINKMPYFKFLNDGTMSKKFFIESQIDVLEAVRFFSKPMFIIASKLETYEQRQTILKNIIDEHGNGNLDEAHGKTFEKFLFSFGVTRETIINSKSSNVVMSFNKSLLLCATNETTMRSIAMMGIIEERYSTMSANLVNAILERGWINKSLLNHYSLHENLDVEHAQGFYDLISDGWHSPISKKEIKKGLIMGNSLIGNLYNGLLKE